MSKLLVLACVVAAFAVTSVALAGPSTVLGGYASEGAKVKDAAASATSTPAASSSGTLPFTGSDLTLFVVGGALLIGLGVGLRRLRPSDK